ncbi:unnamed protein product [Moneuplotes crassus]|uniref:Uncharacterized protein n=1 Tax=Euplotes crassus TaxID=5936 RepID=A0AAD1X6G6_EUPCR|nr:unnamed protein product [Moneuplotes crassus]
MFGNSDFLYEYISSNSLFCENNDEMTCKKFSKDQLGFSQCESNHRTIFTENLKSSDNPHTFQPITAPGGTNLFIKDEEDKEEFHSCESSNSGKLSGPISQHSKIEENLCMPETKNDKPEIKDSSVLASLSNNSTHRISGDGNQGQMKSKFTNRLRFAKTHDRDMFKRLLELCDQAGCEVSEFWRTNSLLNEAQWAIIQTLAKEISWDTEKSEHLIKRINKIGKNSENFTIRDTKLLRKMINSQKKANLPIDFAEISYYFPGKSINTLKSKYNEKYKSGSPHLLP